MNWSWLLHNSNIYKFCHMITYVLVMIFSQSQNMNQKLCWAPTIIISVIEAIAIYHNIGKSQYKSLSSKSTYSIIFSLPQLLTLTRYLWDQSLNQTQRKIGAYNFATIFLYVRLKLRNHKYRVSVSNYGGLNDSWVCGLAL